MQLMQCYTDNLFIIYRIALNKISYKIYTKRIKKRIENKKGFCENKKRINI